MMPRLHEFLSQWGLTVHGLVTLAGLVIYVIASHTRRQRRHPSAAIAWVVSLALMPYLALPLYLLFGSRKVTRGPLLRYTPALPVNGPPSNTPANRFQQLAAAMGLPRAASYEQLQSQQRFDQDWAFATQAAPPAMPLPALAEPASDVAGAQLIASGPDQAEDTLYSLLIASCFTARTRILIITPYFVPDAALLMALTLAARRGVAVDLVLPRHSNHRLADLARPAALREMAAAGASVWLVDEMVHAKAVVIDTELALAGSANLDERSLFLNYELMIAFFRPADVHRFTCWIEQQRATARLYRTKAPSPMVEFSEGLIRWLAFQL